MPGVARSLTLPRGWPRRVRSAAVHAISLADFALTTALGWAAQSLSPRLHLRAEIERLQQRPHYPPTTRLAILELRAARGWSLSTLPPATWPMVAHGLACLFLLRDRAGASLPPPLDVRGRVVHQNLGTEGHLPPLESPPKASFTLAGPLQPLQLSGSSLLLDMGPFREDGG